jgi:predicted PurR-regulated permease PerM
VPASSIPPILFALAGGSPGKAIIVALMYVAIHQLEANVIEPVVMARAVKLHPAVVAVGVVAVESLLGFVGLFVAVPILATFKILVEELWINPNETSRATLAVVPAPSASAAVRETRELRRPRPAAGQIDYGGSGDGLGT